MPAGPPSWALPFTGIRGSRGYRRHSCLGGPLDSHYPQRGVAAPGSPSIQPRGLRAEGEEHEAGLRGQVRMEGSCGVAVPLVSGGRSSEEAGKGRFPVAVGLSPLLPSYPGVLPSFFPSVLPSLPHPSVHSSSSCRVSHWTSTTYSSPLFFIRPPTLYPFQHNPTQLGPSLRGHMVRPCGPEGCGPERNAREDPSAAWGPGRRSWEGSGVWAECGAVSQARAPWGSEGPPGRNIPFVGEGSWHRAGRPWGPQACRLIAAPASSRGSGGEHAWPVCAELRARR